MAHFAKIEDGVVTQMVVVVNHVITDPDGNEQESLGQEFLQGLYGDEATWVQTSYNNNFRKQYAGINDTYDADKDIFIKPQPFPSFTLDENNDWVAPVAYPVDGKDYIWNEDSLGWDELGELG